MTRRISVHALLGTALAVALWTMTGALAAETPLTIGSARITISGTSNIHAYTASTTAVRITRAQFAAGVDGQDVWSGALKPGGVEAFEIVVAAATLTSPREGLDKNMHKALKVTEHPDIVFRLIRLEPQTADAGALRGIGVLRIAGVEREVALDLTTARKGAGLSVAGQVQLLMTDFGIKPPTAMLGMLKTDPKVTVTFDTLLTTSLTTH